MTIIYWADGETTSATLNPGDSVAISNIAIGNWQLLTVGNTIVLDAFGNGSLTLSAADGKPLSPGQLTLTLPDGGLYLYATDNTPVNGGGNEDFLLGDAHNNTLDGGAGKDVLLGGDGDDILTDASGDNILLGEAGNDKLTGGADDDLLSGGDGNDTLDGGGGHSNELFGGPGDDHYVVRSRYDFVVDQSGDDSGVIYANWYKPSQTVEHWTWAAGVQHLPYWIDALIHDYSTYAPLSLGPGDAVFYDFALTAAELPDEADRHGFQPFTVAQSNYTRKAFDYISSLINLSFEEVADGDQPYTIVMGNNLQEGSSGYAYNIQSDGGTALMLNVDPMVKFPGRDNGEALYSVLMHELGHALGLKHPFLQQDEEGNPSDGPFLGASEDQALATVMSYTGEKPGQESQYSPLDIAALQYLWGVSPQAHAGDSRYVLNAHESQMIWDGSGNDTIDGSGLQANLTLFLEPGYWSHAGTQADTITAPGQYTVNFGTQIENAIGGAGDDAIAGNGLDNRIDGGAGNDVLTGAAGNDTLTGGAGTDTAVYSGARGAYTVTATPDGYSISGPDGKDALAGIERLRFDDGVLALDTGKDGAAGQVYRLYQAAFDRKPDAAGVGYWIGQSDHGVSINSIAGSFLRSDEFAKLYGGANPTDEAYLTQLYHNVLHRPYDQAGYDYWLGVLKHGAPRADVLQSFAASDENFAALAAVIGKGFDYTDYG